MSTSAAGTALDELGALDVSYLAAEKPGLPLHIGSLVYLDAAPLLDRRGRFRTRAVRAHVERRLDGVPRLRRRVEWPSSWRAVAGRRRPAWVDDDDFDVARHVRVLHLPPPGDEAQVLEVCARLHEQLLDRAHPLWELWFLTGLGGALAGRVAMVEKIHHALADGVTSVDVVSVLFDGPDDAPRPEIAAAPPNGANGANGVNGANGSGANGNRADGSGAGGWGRELLHTATDLATGAGELLRHPQPAPACSLNRTVSGRRRLAPVRRSVSGVATVRAALGGTLNDVVLAAVAGGVRALLLARGERPHGPLRVLVPVSARSRDQRLGPPNRTAALFVSLPVHLDDPAARLASVRSEVGALKAHHEADATLGLIELADRVPAPVLAPFSRLVVHHQPVVNLVVTNVAGSRIPLSILGARMLQAIPIVPLGGNMALGVAALSYCDQLTLGLHVDPVAVPDVELLAGAVDAAFDELEALAGTGS